MRFVACVCALGALACASASGGNEPQSAVKNLGTVSTGGGGNPVVTQLGNHPSLVQNLAPIYTAPDLGWQATVGAPVDAAYHAIIEGYGTIGVEILSNDLRTRTVGNRRVAATSILGQPLSKFLNCGRDGLTGQPRADSYRVTFSIVSSLSAVDSTRTRVTTLVIGEAADRATTATPVTCSSTGVLERVLLRAAGYQAN